MLMIIKSAPETPEGKRGIKLATYLSADIVLLQNGVYFTQGQKLEDAGFTGKTYVLEDDRLLRGLKADNDKTIQGINYDGLVDLMAENDNAVGMF
jgi:sulfur relay protein TusB/DsrH